MRAPASPVRQRGTAARIASVVSGRFRVLANLLTAFRTALAVRTKPEGPWDHHGPQGITAMGVLAAALARPEYVHTTWPQEAYEYGAAERARLPMG
ncbi:hypothetical protein [Marinactinospora rubrisoli]|uniref:Uncharacterized protein n=1 Tax=Marinactinospora rubrisoli TaxID=2715399 RepID=A0ABW2KJX2_9ACTN